MLQMLPSQHEMHTWTDKLGRIHQVQEVNMGINMRAAKQTLNKRCTLASLINIRLYIEGFKD